MTKSGRGAIDWTFDEALEPLDLNCGDLITFPCTGCPATPTAGFAAWRTYAAYRLSEQLPCPERALREWAADAAGLTAGVPPIALAAHARCAGRRRATPLR